MKKEIKKIEELEAYIGKPFEQHIVESSNKTTILFYDKILAIDKEYEQVICAINLPNYSDARKIHVDFMPFSKHRYFVEVKDDNIALTLKELKIIQ